MGSFPCCGSFCVVVSLICGIMQFVFYGLLSSNSERLDIGESESERKDYADTALWTAIVYSGFVVISVICIIGGGKKNKYELIGDDDEEHSNLINDDEPSVSYDATKESNQLLPTQVNDDHTIQ